jgi:PHD/YefM family antitoxin component YafN of YafNO toxin-antitoxin module
MGKATLNKHYIVDDHGKKTAVIIPLAEYEELMEDLHDLAVAAERKKEPVISFKELKKELKAK